MAGRTFILWGGTGQAKVLRAIIERQGDRVGLVCDSDEGLNSPFPDVLCVHDWDELTAWIERSGGDGYAFAVAIGGTKGQDRLDIDARLQALGLEPVTLVHQRAWVAQSAEIGEGGQICAMAAFGEEAFAGRQCIVNTSASVDHECRLGDGVHIMPGATLAGCVEVGNLAAIGSNATVLPRVRIGSGAQVGAGAVVTKDVPNGATVFGNPARLLR